MTILRPPRREPRSLALAIHPKGLAFAVCDPWELRSSGIQRCRKPTRKLAIRRMIRREKPTLLTTRDPKLLPVVRDVASALRLPIDDGHHPLPSSDTARDLLPEMAHLAPTRSLRHVVRLAVSSVLHAEHISRPYASRDRPALRRAD